MVSLKDVTEYRNGRVSWTGSEAVKLEPGTRGPVLGVVLIQAGAVQVENHTVNGPGGQTYEYETVQVGSLGDWVGGSEKHLLVGAPGGKIAQYEASWDAIHGLFLHSFKARAWAEGDSEKSGGSEITWWDNLVGWLTANWYWVVLAAAIAIALIIVAWKMSSGASAALQSGGVARLAVGR